MEYKLKHEMCLLCGDIHADTNAFFDSVNKCGKIKDTDIIILGDIGLGFYYFDYKDYEYKPYQDHKWVKEIDNWAKENNNDVWVFRGNHDDPAKYAEDSKFWDWFDKVHCLRDGDSVISHNERRYLVVPGSISIDRGGSHRQLGFSYWDDEYIKYDLYESMEASEFYGVFAHSGPTPPSCLKSTFVEEWDKREKDYNIFSKGLKKFPKSLKETITEERENIDKIITKFKPRYWFNGHYHEDAHFERNGCEVFALGICKFLELDRYE